MLDEYSGQILWRGNTLGEALTFIDGTVGPDLKVERDDGLTVVCAAAEVRRWLGAEAYYNK